MAHTIQVDGLTDEVLSRLDDRAREIGVARNAYVRRLIERAVAPQDAWTPLAELLAPSHDYTEAQGISEDEIERFFKEELAAKRKRQG